SQRGTEADGVDHIDFAGHQLFQQTRQEVLATIGSPALQDKISANGVPAPFEAAYHRGGERTRVAQGWPDVEESYPIGLALCLAKSPERRCNGRAAGKGQKVPPLHDENSPQVSEHAFGMCRPRYHDWPEQKHPPSFGWHTEQSFKDVRQTILARE